MMSWFNRMVERFQEQSFDDINDEFDKGRDQHLDINDDYVEDDDFTVEPPSTLAKLMARVMEYREQEIRDLRAEAYDAHRERDEAKKALGIATYERDEALGRIAKIYPILNQKQQKQLQKPPVMLKFGPPQLKMHVWDESILDFRRVDVPPPATMKTVRRKGSHGGVELKPVTIYPADKKAADGLLKKSGGTR